MAAFEPPYDIAVHPRYEDTPFDELPKWLQNRIEKYCDPADVVTDEEDEHILEEEEVEEEDLDESGDPMPVDVEFPHHKGGGYYVLSNGQVVRGSDEAEEAQAELDG